MVDNLNKRERLLLLLKKICIKVPIVTLFLYGFLIRSNFAMPVSFDVLATLSSIQQLLMEIGPVLSGVLFVTAGIFYALGQLFPSYKRASLHTMAIDLIIGAIVVAVLSIASTNLAIASTHLLSNVTSNSV